MPSPAVCVCASCNHSNPASNAFCQACGGALGLAAVETSTAGTGTGERRQLTAFFSDLVGFTALSCKLDVEDLQELMSDYYRTCRNVVERLDGHVAQLLGDGVLAYFGYPLAHEDDAVRAVTASLTLQTSFQDFARRWSSRLEAAGAEPPAMRIGIHTGVVVIDDSGPRGEPVTLGTSLNVAARLQSIAPIGGVVISDATRRLVQGLFVLEPLGAQQLRGVDSATDAYRVVRPSGVATRLELGAKLGLTPFIGRRHELALLEDRWEQAIEGHGQAVLVTGEAGVGKSRMVQRLRERIASAPHTWLEARSSPYHTNTAFHAIIDLIQHGIFVEPEDDEPTRLAKLEAAVESAGLSRDEVVPLFASLISISGVPTAESAESWRRRTLDAMVEWILALAARQPVILAVEDLHWVDPSTHELLSLLMGRVQAANVLVLLTSRPELQPWPQWPSLTHLRLNPLTKPQTREMLEAVVRRASLPESVLGALMAKCDGVPLFVEELTKAVLESVPPIRDAADHVVSPSGGTAVLARHERPAASIPSTLRDSLTARLDRLGPARELAQIASVLGREFSHDVLAAVAPMSDSALAAAVDNLVEVELFYRRGVAPHATYLFKHALIQEAAYESMLRSRRIELHGRIADVLEHRFPEIARNEPETIARHYAQAQRYEEAAERYRRAGELAKQRVANTEAIDHLHDALEVLSRAPDSDRKRRIELALQVALGAPLIATQGYAYAEVGRVFERALELCDAAGSGPELFEALYGHSAYSLNTTRMRQADSVSRRLLELAPSLAAPSRLPWAHQQMGCVHYFRGEPAHAQHHFEKAIASYHTEEQRELLHVFGQDAAAACLALSGMTLGQLGRWNASIESSRAAVERARESQHPFSLAFAMCFYGYNLVQRRDRSQLIRLAEQIVALVDEQGLSQWIPSSLIISGWSKEDPAEAVATMQAGLLAGTRRGARIGAPFQIAMLAERQLDLGDHETAAMTASMALAVADETDNHYADVDLHRLCGDIELHRTGGSRDAALAHYRRSLEVADQQRAVGLGLRSSIRLARLLADGGGRRAAIDLLDRYSRVSTSSAETADERDAASLLAELR
jgi:predicted ATPase/class 3 adenylate cyclase